MTLKLRFGDIQYLSSCRQKTKTKTAQTESQNDISSFPVLCLIIFTLCLTHSPQHQTWISPPLKIVPNKCFVSYYSDQLFMEITELLFFLK